MTERVIPDSPITTEPERTCYVGVTSCACPVAVIVDGTSQKMLTAELGRWVRSGYTIERSRWSGHDRTFTAVPTNKAQNDENS